ncbi:uncharacterized protein MELLADRAFT_89034 [Melampsora larici-populina 98AG31]|uniref:Uncharacterized protein n=1 Tax=Melampsora larici-populina (strain 98AG31 / pathotype 3-4-7) TaxID=747676 RepID=F4R6R2_MELLP|nr:uncharacterized protein MELLADRAFT_89034 [Melampsora larici-populina 98AG31]EGG12414.1 hypothetical protein MELLADRAFT_89034 [Melampsora larici-populina 98AG31]
MAPPVSQKRKMPQRVTRNTKKPKPAPAPPSSRAKQSTKPTTKRSTNSKQQPAEPIRPNATLLTLSDKSDNSDSSEEDDHAWEDQEEDQDVEDVDGQDEPAARPQTQPRLPHPNARLKHKITLENYKDLDLDIYTINKLLSASGRKTRNRIPSDIQNELKNLQFMYRRAKKMLALAAKCSEKTVNEFLEYQNETKLLSKLS